MSFFDKLKIGLGKTKSNINEKFNDVFSNFRKVDEDLLDELEEILIMSDIGMDTSVEIISRLKDKIKKENIKEAEEVKQALRLIMEEILEVNSKELKLNTTPSIILVIGVNGVGKTTSIGKIANNLKKQNKKVLLAAADTFRAAAVEQLDILANRVGCDIVKKEEGVDPASVVYDAIKKAKEEAGAYPLYYTEWNGGHFDTNYAAAAVTQTLAYNEGLVEGYSYWCVSDIFEEMGLHGLPFNNEFGLVNVYGTPKPSFRLFEELHKAGAKRLDVAGEGHRTAEVLALADENRVTLFCYNHDIEERDIKAEEMEIAVAGGVKRIQKGVIDATHANPIVVWEAQGKPSYPTKEQIQEIEEASHIAFEEIPVAEGDQVLRFTAEPESITIFRIDKA